MAAKSRTHPVRGLDRITRKLDRDLVERPLASLLRTAAAAAQRVASERAPRVTGALARSITAKTGSRMAKVGSTLSYARAVEEGAPPRREGRFFMRAAAEHVRREMPRWLHEMGRAIGARWSGR
ncbi:MAG: HK97 gp10 family phage protein [Chloroflexi bacterium]|nr:HK97 gp10 family phage protein [Chloroflexota bacterium]MCY3937890.1 HK97 gp10 family phage protein [Chloroflexota bacterium]